MKLSGQAWAKCQLTPARQTRMRVYLDAGLKRPNFLLLVGGLAKPTAGKGGAWAGEG